MASADYHAVLEAIASILRDDSRTQGVPVFVEQDPQFGLSDSGKAICVVLNSRVPEPNQPAAAGKRTRFILSVSVWVIGFSAESFERAAKVRDDLLGPVELVLMDNRTLSGTVSSSWLGGGTFSSARDDNGLAFCALAETSIEARIAAINT